MVRARKAGCRIADAIHVDTVGFYGKAIGVPELEVVVPTVRFKAVGKG